MSTTEEQLPSLSRRRFLAGSAVSAAAMAVGSLSPVHSLQEMTAASESRLTDEPVFRLAGVVYVNGSYLAAAVVDDHIGLHRLELEQDNTHVPGLVPGSAGARRVRVGPRIGTDVPDEFIWGELSLAGGRPVLAGGRAFMWSEEEVVYDTPAEIRRSMETFPAHVPSAGSRQVSTVGIEPALYGVGPGGLEPIALPSLPRRLLCFAASAIEGADGSLIVLLAHSEDRDEGVYASGVELGEQAKGAWRVDSLATGLGESGPHFLALQKGQPVSVLNGSRAGSLHTRRGGRHVRAKVPFEDQEIKAAGLGEHGELVVYSSADHSRPLQRWLQAAPDGQWVNRGPVAVEGEAVVDAWPVRGTQSECLLLGTSSAWVVAAA